MDNFDKAMLKRHKKAKQNEKKREEKFKNELKRIATREGIKELKKFGKKASRYINDVDSQYLGMGYGNASEVVNNVASNTKKMDDSVAKIRTMMRLNKDKFSKEDRKDINSAIGRYKKARNVYSNAIQKNADVFSRFGSKEEYDNAVAVNKILNMSMSDIEAKVAKNPSGTAHTDIDGSTVTWQKIYNIKKDAKDLDDIVKNAKKRIKKEGWKHDLNFTEEETWRKYIDEDGYEQHEYLNPLAAVTHIEKVQNEKEAPYQGEDYTDYIPFIENRKDDVQKYAEMDEEERRIYTYLYQKEGIEKAEEYANLLWKAPKGTRHRAATEYAEANVGPVRSYVLSAGAGGASSFVNIEQAIAATRGEVLERPLEEYAENIAQQQRIEQYGEGSWEASTHDVVRSIGSEAEKIGWSTLANFIDPTHKIGGRLVGGTMTYGQAFGGAYYQMREEGYTDEEAKKYAHMSATSEVLLDQALSGVYSVGGAIPKKAFGKVLPQIKNGVLRASVDLASRFGSEAIEEFSQAALEKPIKALATGKDIEKINWSDVFYEGIIGGFTGMVLGSGEVAANNLRTQSLGSGLNVQDVSDTVTNMPDLARNTRYGRQATKLNEQIQKKGRVSNFKKGAAIELVQMAENQGVADVIRQQVNTESVSDSERKILKSALKKIDKNEINTLTDKERNVVGRRLAIHNIKTAKTEAEAVADAEVASETDIPTELEPQTVRKTATLTDTDQEIEVQGLVNTENGTKMRVKTLDDGDTHEVDVDEVSFADEGQAIIYNQLAEADIPEGMAQDMISKYDGTTVKDAINFVRGIKTAFTYGKHNMVSDMQSDPYVNTLSDEVRNTAFQYGSVYEGDRIRAATPKAKQNTEAGRVIFDGDVKKLNATKRSQISALEVLSEAIGKDIHLYESYEKNGTRMYKDQSGVEKVAPNGFYDPKTGELAVDVNAGNFGQGLILNTASHELGHFIQDWSAEEYKSLADFLVSKYGEAGVSVDTLVKRQQAKSARNGKELTYDEAFDEFVADSLSTMLQDGEVIQELASTNETLFNKIKAWIDDFVKKLGKMLKLYDIESEEGRIISEMANEFKEMQKKFVSALKSAGENFKASEVLETSDVVTFDESSNSVAPKLSERTWTQSEYVAEREKTIQAISNQLGISVEDAQKYVDDINGIARLIADDRVRLDYEPNVDENATVLKPNSEYKYSVDMSTLCAKRLITTGTFDAIQKLLPNTVFSSEDLVELREMMLERGYEVACGICYVESTRREMGAITQQFIDNYIEAQKTGKPITRTNSSGKVVELKKTKDEMKSTFDKSTDKFYASKDYTPTLADLNTTDIDVVKTEHPEVYEAYLNFMNARGQAKPKLLETRAEYKGEILEKFKTKPAVNARNKAGGLRLQSFSDFEVPHMIDMMQVIMDMSRVGLKSQAYTKVPAFAKVFGNTGVKINLSLIAKGDGIDSDGNLIFDDVEGMPHEEAFKIRKEFSDNVGTILVGKNDQHIIKAMADPRIDFIIPFHKSSWKESLYASLGLTGYSDYTDTQNEKAINGEKISNYDPSEYWDFTKSGDENAKIYLEKCKKEGRIPKFPQFQGYPGYWKLLIDFKMYNNEGVGVPQQIVKPTFEMDSARKILEDYKGGHRNFPVAQDVVDDFVEKHKKHENPTEGADIRHSDRDYSYNELISKPDIVIKSLLKVSQNEITKYKSDRDLFAKEMVKNAAAVGNGKNTSTSTFLYCDDLGEDVQITRNSFKHGAARMDASYIAVCKNTPDVLKHSIVVNEIAEREDTNGGYVLLGLAEDKDNYIVVRSIVNKKTWKLEEYNELYAIRKKNINKEDVGFIAPALRSKNGYVTPSTIKISDFLKIVNSKSLANIVLPLDVINKLNSSREYDPKITPDLLYSDRSTDFASTRSLLANALENTTNNEIELKKLNEYKREIDNLDALQEDLAEINEQIKELSFKKGGRTDADKQKLSKLKDDAVKATNRINLLDKKLLNLESTKILKDVLAREKKKAAAMQKTKDKEFMAKQKAKSEQKISEIIAKNKESRKKSVEGRHKTVVKNKLKRVVNELNSLLNKGTKEKNVKLGLQDVVGKALKTAEALFSDDITNADIARFNADTSEAFAEYARIADELANPTRDTDVAKLKRRLSKLNSDLKTVFAHERAKLNLAPVSTALEELANAYYDLQKSEDKYIRENAFAQGMYDKIDSLKNKLAGTTVQDMTLDEIQEVYDMYKAVKHMVSTANEIFRNGRAEVLADRVDNVQKQILHWQKKGKDKSVVSNSITKGLNTFTWSNLKPYYAFDRVGSKAFTELFWDLTKADGVWALDTQECADFIENAREKHGYKKWDMDKAKKFESANGHEFQLTLGDMMSIYAYSKRPQAHEHMSEGGFVFDDGNLYVPEGKKGKRVHKETDKTYRVTAETVSKIVKELTPEQIAYVNDVQKFMTEFGEKGNEVSRQLYGIDIFTEEMYFPLKSSKDYRSAVEQALNATNTMVSLKNTGMTKQTVPHANNPIVLSRFDDVVLEHLDKMSKYHAYVMPIENLQKVFNNVGREAGSDGDYRSTQAIISSVYGNEATKYFNDFITDINGGTNVSGATNPLMNLFATSKKVAVSASASVVVQQYFAILRAMNVIDAKYFVPFKGQSVSKSSEKQWNELKKYAPVAIIKEIGGHDIGSSRGFKGYVGGNKQKLTPGIAWEKTSDAMMWASAKMDEIGWSSIWRAVKKEIADTTDLKVGSEEFFKACGDRFTQVVAMTQVYDSTTSRSGYMRSKYDSVKFATSFMGEPTTVANMVSSAVTNMVRDFSEGKGIKAVKPLIKTTTFVAMSQLATDIAKSLIYAGRKDEEDEAFLEKWAEQIGNSIRDDVNPLNYLPFARDVVSMIEGWDIERPDAQMIGDIIDSCGKLFKDGEFKPEAIPDVIFSISNITGFPLKNLYRDLYEMPSNLVSDATGTVRPTWEGAWNAFVRGIKNEKNKKSSSGSGGASESKPKVNTTTYVNALIGGDANKSKELFDGIVATSAEKNGISKKEAKERTISYAKSELKDRHQSGEVNDYKAFDILSKTFGYGRKEAKLKVKAWNFEKNNPDADIPESSLEKYYDELEPKGISEKVFQLYYERKKGKTTREEILKVIDSLPISTSKKNALYYYNGYASSTLSEAPW